MPNVARKRGTITLSTPDLYGGSAVTTQNIIRKVGSTSTTDVAGAATFTPNVGDTYEILFGIDSDDDDAEPYGGMVTYKIPCKEVDEVEFLVVDDSVAGDLVVFATDPDDGNNIGDSNPVDIDVGQVKTIPIKWTGAFEEDFGNRWCEDDEGVGNVMVVRYNTSQYDDAYVTDSAGNKYPAANVAIGKLLSASSGYTDLTFEVPVFRSNADNLFKLVMEADAIENPDGGTSNITVYVYDSGRYIDNDVTPSAWKCGIMDEDGGEVGAVAADSISLYVTND